MMGSAMSSRGWVEGCDGDAMAGLLADVGEGLLDVTVHGLGGTAGEGEFDHVAEESDFEAGVSDGEVVRFM